MKTGHLSYSVILFLISLGISCFVIFFLTTSCRGKQGNATNAGESHEESEMVFADRFTLIKTDSCTIVTIRNPWQGAEDFRKKYYLVPKEHIRPLQIDSSSIIYVPVRKIICMSATHLAMISALKEVPSIAAVSGKEYIFNPDIIGRIKSGAVGEVGYDSGLNNELILKIKPDLVMMYGIGSESAGYTSRIEELGINVMFNADYLETHPLGKAEWIKVFGALFCREKMADSIFLSVSESYNSIKDKIAAGTVSKPCVLLGLPYKDTWYISPGNSYISELISDAGGNYLWSGTESVESMPLGIEDVFIKSLKADYWLNTGNAGSREEISGLDQRFNMLPCFISGKIYNNNKRINSTGGNDYWESGAVHPDSLLMDIACILHPGIFPGYELRFYRMLE